MGILNIEEAIHFFKSYGFRVDEKSIKEWVNENNKKANSNGESRPIDEDDLYRYNDWCLTKGTAYEDGIDGITKIARLLKENFLLKKEIEKLKKEKLILEDLLGMNDWFWK